MTEIEGALRPDYFEAMEQRQQGYPLDVRAVALALGVTPDAVRKAIARGAMAARLSPGPKGRRYVVDPNEVARYRRENRVERKAQP